MKSFMLFAVLLGLTSLGWAESRRDASTERLVDAGKVLRRIMDTPATGIPKEILNQAKCIARGAFAGLALTGASIRRDDDSMQAIYRHNVTTRSVLLGEVAAPEAALPFMSAVPPKGLRFLSRLHVVTGQLVTLGAATLQPVFQTAL